MVASHAEVARPITGCSIWGCTDLYSARGPQGVLPMRVGGDKSIGSTVSDAIVRCWLWSIATRSSVLGYYSRLLQVVENWPTFWGTWFSTGRLLTIELFTFIIGVIICSIIWIICVIIWIICVVICSIICIICVIICSIICIICNIICIICVMICIIICIICIIYIII